MILNYETCIVGEKCILVPYRPEHIQTYHEWMQDPDLLEATGSEPLSMQEEVAMQQSWRDDPHKCTFIVLSRRLLCDPEPSLDETNRMVDAGFVERNLNAMVGDVNLFLSEQDGHETVNLHNHEPLQQQHDSAAPEAKHLQAELDIMIAEKRHRRSGLGKEASCLMMLYGATKLGIRRFFCRINEDNHSSLRLFKRLGFHQCNYAECFRQVEMELKRETAEETAQEIMSLVGRNELPIMECPISEAES